MPTPKYAKLITETIKDNLSDLISEVKDTLDNDIYYSEELANWFCDEIKGVRDWQLYRDGRESYIVTNVKGEGFPDYDEVIETASQQAKVDAEQIRDYFNPSMFEEHFRESVQFELENYEHKLEVVGRSGDYWGYEWDSGWVLADEIKIKQPYKNLLKIIKLLQKSLKL
jgi:hypothetical protein